MNAVTRWKTITTIAVAFSAGNLFATACQDATKASAQDGTTDAETTDDGTTGDGDGAGADGGTTAPPEVTEAELAEVAANLDALSDTVATLSTSLTELASSVSDLTTAVTTVSDAHAETVARVDRHACMLDILRDADGDGEAGEDNSTFDEYELVTAMAACGI